MERISSKLFRNCRSKKGISNNENVTLNDENSEISATLTMRNISSKLFEENIDENTNEFVDMVALQSVERSFYDILGQQCSPSPSDYLQQSNWLQLCPSTTSKIQNESLPVSEFQRGLEEGMKFLPSIGCNESAIVLQPNKLWFHSERKRGSDIVQRKLKEGENEDTNIRMLKGKKHANSGELSLLEGRKSKISVLYYKNRAEPVDKVFLLHEDHYAKEAHRLRVMMQGGTKSCSPTGVHGNLVDLKTLLIHCSQAIVINDIQNANKLIKQIKKHSSPHGDGVQRMAHIVVNGLEARLNGTNGELYQLSVPQETVTDYLNSFYIYLVSCPILMVSQYFVNYTILNAITKESKLHIINLGTEFGLNWPSLIHSLSIRIGGPPKFRITNIETPISCYLPDQRSEVARQKLEFFCRSFGVPLEYRALRTKWDKICIDDINTEKDEVVIVNCFHGFEYLVEEENMMNSPKNQVLNIIRRIRPHVFIQGIINGPFNSSFFVDRFKQVLLYTSAMFDFFDATIPQNNKQRQFLENNLWGRFAVNIIACEGSKRFVGADSYKQWNTKNSREGFEQLLLDHVILKRIKDKVRKVYHKNFFIDNDKQWLLLGWKGRVMSAVSAWYPTET